MNDTSVETVQRLGVKVAELKEHLTTVIESWGAQFSRERFEINHPPLDQEQVFRWYHWTLDVYVPGMKSQPNSTPLITTSLSSLFDPPWLDKFFAEQFASHNTSNAQQEMTRL